MSRIFVFCTILFMALSSQAGVMCKPGYDFSTDKWGNELCLAGDGSVFSVVGSLRDCPAGYDSDMDKYGNDVCQNEQVMAYDLSNGCLAFMNENYDMFGNKVCQFANGKNVTQLIKPSSP